jgi:hypothetical protein
VYLVVVWVLSEQTAPIDPEPRVGFGFSVAFRADYFRLNYDSTGFFEISLSWGPRL